MWDAWATYDPTADGLHLHGEAQRRRRRRGPRTRRSATPPTASSAARFIKAVGGAESLVGVRRRHGRRCATRSTVTATDGDTPPPSATAIAAAVIAYGLAGRLERGGRLRRSRLQAGQRARSSSNKPGTIDERPEPLAAAPARAHDHARTGSRSTNGVQQADRAALGPRHGLRAARGGAERRADRSRARRRASAIRRRTRRTRTRPSRSSATAACSTPTRTTTIDISPGARGGNTLGTNDGTGTRSTRRPASRTPPDVVNAGDFARVMAEFWADGPKSETPPGHWNVLANAVSDELGAEPPDRRRRADRRPAPVGREAVPRAQRRGPRRGDRGLGPQGLLRLRAADLDDPLHGRPRPVERSGAAVLQRGGPAARART